MSLNIDGLQKPLSYPEFGSYSADDVVWLLKDLKDVEIEAPREEREELIQKGEAHCQTPVS